MDVEGNQGKTNNHSRRDKMGNTKKTKIPVAECAVKEENAKAKRNNKKSLSKRVKIKGTQCQ